GGDQRRPPGADGHLVDALLDLALHRRDLGADVEPEQLQDIEQHQLRRPQTPIRKPMAAAPAKAPSGLRRASASSSPAKDFACSPAVEANRAPWSARPPAKSPTVSPTVSFTTCCTCAATLPDTSRADFAASPVAWAMNLASVSLRWSRSFRIACKSEA